MYATIKNGQIGLADPNSDSVDFQVVPPQVSEGTLRLETAEGFIEAEGLRNRKAQMKRTLKLAKQRIRNASIKSEEAFARKMNREAINPPTVSQEELKIRDSILRGRTKNPDFSQMESLFSHGDFGSRADFEQFQVIGNPLRADGKIGPVSDYDRFTKDKRYEKWRAVSTGQMGSRDLASRIAVGENEMVNQSMGSWLSDITGINLDVSDKIDEALPQLEDEAAKYLTTQGSQIVQNITSPQPQPVKSTAPAPIRAIQTFVANQTTGKVQLPGIGLVDKKYLFYGGIGLVTIGVLGFLYTRRQSK